MIDPGPTEATHLDALMTAIAGRPVRAIMCTHTHRDHSPAAAPLAVLTGAPVIGCAPLTLEDDGPRADAAFDPRLCADRVLADGEQVRGEGWGTDRRGNAGPYLEPSLLCIGHRACAVYRRSRHGWSTTVVSPPDGNMTDYLASLDKLMRRDDIVYYPAHGEPVSEPRRLVRGTLGHRRMREGQILRYLERSGPSAVPDLVSAMYAAPRSAPSSPPAAGRSVLAHLIDLERAKSGRAGRRGLARAYPRLIRRMGAISRA